MIDPRVAFPVEHFRRRLSEVVARSDARQRRLERSAKQIRSDRSDQSNPPIA